MNSTPPPVPASAPRKSGLPSWAIVLIVLGVVGFLGIVVVGLLAAIAIPNFVRARETAQMNMCVNNLRMIDGAKQQWSLESKKEQADTPQESDLTIYLPNSQMPFCPAGGRYTLNPVSQVPTCSNPKHQLPPLPKAPGR